MLDYMALSSLNFWGEAWDGGTKVAGIGGKVHSKSKILSGKWIWPFPLDPFLQVRGTRPAHSAPASVTLLSYLLCSPQPLPWTLLAFPLTFPFCSTSSFE